MAAGYHPYGWVLWLAAGMCAALVTRNPFYLSIIAVSALFVFAAIVRRDPAAEGRAQAWRSVVWAALVLWGFSIVFNALTVHLGARVLFELPSGWPVIGGAITAEALVYGVVSGLSFVALLWVFAAFNAAVGPQTLLRLTPAFVYQAGVALTIAVSFVPQTLLAWQEIREAQRLRGQTVRRLTDLQPLVVSLLGSGLDRAVRLAESMDARGFGGRVTPWSGRTRQLAGAGLLGGLTLLLVGLALWTFGTGRWAGVSLMIGGGAMLMVVFHKQGQRVQRSRYRRWLWRRRDTALTMGATTVLLGALAVSLLAPQSLFYYPYPPYALMPTFHPIVGLLLALLMLPALLLPQP